MSYGRLLALWCLLLAAPVHAGDPHPPQITVSFPAQPAPLVQDGTTRLYYEMVVTNFSRDSYVLDAVEASAGALKAKFEGPPLAALPLRPGAAKAESPANPTDLSLASGRAFIVFLELNLGKDKAPRTIAHVLHVRDDKGEVHDVVIAPLAVSDEAPIVVAPPLRGEWNAGDSASNLPDAAHRRAVLLENGQAFVAQRFAIDWVQYEVVDGKRTTRRGPEDRNESYFCYDKPIYSVAAGKVIGMADGLPENVPHSGKYAVELSFDNAGGNHVVVEIAPHRYVLYAHMKPGTVRVKVGDTVGVGDLLGLVGNSGSSTEPHLHMHIVDQPSFLVGNGLPYEFTAFDASGPVEADVSSPTAINIGTIGPQKPFTNDYPANNAEVTFR